MLPGGRAWRIIKEMMKSRGGMFVARVTKFLNLSAAGHARLALPPAKIALVAASCLFAVVCVGAFVVALPGMSFSADAVVDGAAREQPGKDSQGADASEQPAEDAGAQEDDATTEDGETDAQDGAAAAAGDASTCWSGYYAVRDYVRSNGSRWCGAQENLIGAYRCLAWYAESGDEANLAEYRSYKAAVSL